MTGPLDTAALVDLLTADVGRAMALTGAAPPGLAVEAVRVAVGQRPGEAVRLLPDPLHPEEGWLAEVVLTPAVRDVAGAARPVRVLLGGEPLTALRGVDSRTAGRLRGLGVADVGALAELPAEDLPRLAAAGLRFVDAWSRAVLLDRVVVPTGDPGTDATPLDRLLTDGAAPLAARTSPEVARRVLLDVGVLAAALDVTVLRRATLARLAR